MIKSPIFRRPEPAADPSVAALEENKEEEQEEEKKKKKEEKKLGTIGRENRRKEKRIKKKGFRLTFLWLSRQNYSQKDC